MCSPHLGGGLREMKINKIKIKIRFSFIPNYSKFQPARAVQKIRNRNFAEKSLEFF